MRKAFQLVRMAMSPGAYWRPMGRAVPLLRKISCLLKLLILDLETMYERWIRRKDSCGSMAKIFFSKILDMTHCGISLNSPR